MDAQDVLNDMVRHYAALRSYSDVGEVTMTLPNFETRTPFSTVYKEPALFRFDFKVPHPYPLLSHVVSQHAVGFDGTTAYAITKRYKGNVKSESLDRIGLAVADAARISNGAAHTIGRLLLKDTDGLSISELVGAQFNEDTAIDGTACYSIAAKYPTFIGKYELWIEKDTLLLRKFLSEHEISRFEESRTNIRINEPIDDTIFVAALKNQAA